MDSLPLLVLEQISSYLSTQDLRPLRLVNRICSIAAAKELFSILRFEGCEQQARWGYIGRSRYTEYGGLQKAVEEVLPLARYVRTFHFAPAFYHNGLWQAYKRKLDKNRRRGVVVSPTALDEETWLRIMAEQKDNQDAVISSLTTLFKEMKRLRRIEIAGPVFSVKLFEGFDLFYISQDTGHETSKVAMFIRDVFEGLHQAERKIKELDIRGLLAHRLRDAEPVKYVLSGLESLCLDVRETSFLLENAAESEIKTLLEHARPTLRNLEMWANEHPQLPERGIHTLTKMFFCADGTTPMVFPSLRSFALGSLIIDTQPFIDFLAAQPEIASLKTYFIYLGTPGLGWVEVATAMPASIQEWNVGGELGNEPYDGFEPPVGYNWIKRWQAWEEPRLSETGWFVDQMGKTPMVLKRIQAAEHEA